MDNQGKGVQRILFLTPGATSSGGNVFLLRFLRWFRRNCEIPFIVLFEHGGDLESEFEELGETYKLASNNNSSNLIQLGLKKTANRLGIRKRVLKEIVRRKKISLIFSNTGINHSSLPLFKDLKVPVVSLCHELESVTRLTGAEEFRETCRLTNHFIAVSGAVQKELEEKHAVYKGDISLVHGSVPLEEIKVDQVSAKREVCEALGIPSDAFIVGASGTLNWRKAPEIFLMLAAYIAKHHSGLPIYFVWVGGARRDDYSLYCARYDIRKMGLSERVFFLEHTANPLHYFAAIDVFAMVSREDPFPLVCLEAAALGKPIICFENAGGISEFVGQERGRVVPYMDIQVFAEKIIGLLEDPILKQTMGNNAVAKIRSDHDLESAAPKILEIIKRYANGTHLP